MLQRQAPLLSLSAGWTCPEERVCPTREAATHLGAERWLHTTTTPACRGPPRPEARQWGPLLVLIALMALVFAMGWHKLLSFKTIGLNYESLKAFIAENMVLALLIYIAGLRRGRRLVAAGRAWS